MFCFLPPASWPPTFIHVEIRAPACSLGQRAAFSDFSVPDPILGLTHHCFHGLDLGHVLYAFNSCAIGVLSINVLILIRTVSRNIGYKLVAQSEKQKPCTIQPEIFPAKNKTTDLLLAGSENGIC